MPITTEYKTISALELTPYEKNPRYHAPHQVQKIIESIKEHGWTSPVIVDENYKILAGHGRLLAADRMRLEEIPCLVVRGMTEAQKKAYVIKDNQLTMMSTWDEELLKQELLYLDDNSYDLDSLGFDDKFLEELMSSPVIETEDQDFIEGVSTRETAAVCLKIYGDSMADLEELVAEMQDRGFTTLFEFPKKSKKKA